MHSNHTQQIIDFLRHIGLSVIERPISESSILPGITVERGAIVVDLGRLLYPGDLLHEAGHLAVVPASERMQMHNNVGNDGGMEMGAIAWSYAAAVYLGIPPDVLFHENGYRGAAESLIENFGNGRYIGVPILAWRGLAQAPTAHDKGAPGYPAMERWLSA
jgi:hypothetical protein